MNFIINELKYAQDILRNKDISNDTIKKIIILIKYYKHLGMNKSQIYSEIEDFMILSYPNYNNAMWQDLIQDLVTKFYKSKHKLRIIEGINITKEEIDFILSKKNDKMERVLFIMLVYAKLYNSNGWINTDIKYIFKYSNCRDVSKNQYLYLNKLYNEGLVEFPKSIKNNSFRITYINDSGNSAIEIKDFDDPIMYYYKYKNPNDVGICEICGKKILKKGKNTKYCPKCFTSTRREYYKEKKREYRKK